MERCRGAAEWISSLKNKTQTEIGLMTAFIYFHCMEKNMPWKWMVSFKHTSEWVNCDRIFILGELSPKVCLSFRLKLNVKQQISQQQIFATNSLAKTESIEITSVVIYVLLKCTIFVFKGPKSYIAGLHPLDISKGWSPAI